MSPQEAFLDRLMRQRVQGMLEKPEHLKCLRHDHSRLQRIQRLFGRHLDEAGTSMYKLVAAAHGESWDFEDDEKNPATEQPRPRPNRKRAAPRNYFPGYRVKGIMTTWLQHVKKVHASGSTSFKESLKRASASWKKQKGTAKAPKAKATKRKGRKKKKDEDEDEVLDEAEAAPSTSKRAAPKKKKRKLRSKAGPKLSGKGFRNVDSVNL